MAKTLFSFILILFFYGCSILPDKTHIITPNVTTPATIPPKKDTIVVVPTVKRLTPKEIYDSQEGVRELTGNNDGKAVEMYLKSVGLGKGYAWCAAFVHWVLDSAGIKNTISAWSPTAHNSKNIVWFNRKAEQVAMTGDVFTLYSYSLGRIHHTGFLDEKSNDNIYQSVEGNTNKDGVVNGDGVYRRKRSFNATYSITRWK